MRNDRKDITPNVAIVLQDAAAGADASLGEGNSFSTSTPLILKDAAGADASLGEGNSFSTPPHP